MNLLLRFHHHGLAVKDPQGAFRFLSVLGYDLGQPLFDPLQRVNLALCTHSTMPVVEVVWPGDGVSPIDRYLKHGPSLYHTCYETRDVDRWIIETEARGLDMIMVCPPTPAVLFGGRKVSFYLIEGFGLVEILHDEDIGGSTSTGTAFYTVNS